MKIYYVEYRWDKDSWRADMPFNCQQDAQIYIQRQMENICLGHGSHLAGYTTDDFRITERIIDIEDKNYEK
jgi:hypothetical protein